MLKFKRIFRPKSEFQVVCPAKTGDLQKKKRSSSQKRHKNLCKSTKNTNLGLDLRSKAPSLLISSGHSLRLGGHNFRLGGNKQSVGGARSGESRKFWWGKNDKIYEHKLCIISKFWMFMINVLDLAQTCWKYF